MKRLMLSMLTTMLFAPAAHALDEACERYLAAAEKSALQPARHTVSDGGGLRAEAIVADGKFYVLMDGKWREMKIDLGAAERQLITQIRAGKFQIADCKAAGSETVEGIPTSVVSYTLTMPGTPPAAESAYIGKDGLVYAKASGETRVRYYYTGVKVPAQ